LGARISTRPKLPRSFGGGHSYVSLRMPRLGGTSGGCTPDRSKLFGSHGQRPWIYNRLTARPSRTALALAFPSTTTRQLGGPAFWHYSTGGPPNTEEFLQLGVARFGRIDRSVGGPPARGPRGSTTFRTQAAVTDGSAGEGRRPRAGRHASGIGAYVWLRSAVAAVRPGTVHSGPA
jgi:hypothetical protein